MPTTHTEACDSLYRYVWRVHRVRDGRSEGAANDEHAALDLAARLAAHEGETMLVLACKCVGGRRYTVHPGPIED